MTLPSSKAWLLLLGLAVAGPAVAADETAMPMPAWFVAPGQTAAVQGEAPGRPVKGVMLFFWMEACGYCERMVSSTLRFDAVATSATAAFDAVGVNLFDDAPLPWLGGEQSSGRRLARYYQVQTTPTTVFVDAAGRELNRIVGYLPSKAFMREIEIAARRQR